MDGFSKKREPGGKKAELPTNHNSEVHGEKETPDDRSRQTAGFCEKGNCQTIQKLRGSKGNPGLLLFLPWK